MTGVKALVGFFCRGKKLMSDRFSFFHSLAYAYTKNKRMITKAEQLLFSAFPRVDLKSFLRVNYNDKWKMSRLCDVICKDIMILTVADPYGKWKNTLYSNNLKFGHRKDQILMFCYKKRYLYMINFSKISRLF